ncbi:MAG: type II toxin-antitoxin system VapC family toxin [Pyrinomonadaceae bacterium]
MSKWVLDSSAVLAVIFGEPGHEIVKSRFSVSSISAINAAEVLSTLADRGQVTDDDIADFTRLRLKVVDFDFEQAEKVAVLRPLTRHLGLSLGDRSCLALAILEGATAVTADRAWKDLDVCSIEMIR